MVFTTKLTAVFLYDAIKLFK